MATLQEIVAEVDRQADGRPIGEMQAFRTSTKGMKRQNRRVFGGLKHGDWTFHRGGREELQFNIGFEEGNEKGRLRYGVACESACNFDPLDVTPISHPVVAGVGG